jgi:hypothetical protein
MTKGDKVYCARLDSWNGKRKIDVPSTTVVTVFKNGVEVKVSDREPAWGCRSVCQVSEFAPTRSGALRKLAASIARNLEAMRERLEEGQADMAFLATEIAKEESPDKSL